MRSYSIGVFLNIFDNDTKKWKEQISEIGKLGGAEHVEVLLEYLPQTRQEKELLISLLQDYRIIIHAPFMDLSLLSPHSEITAATVQILQDTIVFANELSAEVMTIHAERYPHFWNVNDAKKKVVECMKILSKKATFPLAIENLSHAGSTQFAYPSTPDHLQALSQVFPSEVGITIDTGHLLKDEYSVYEVIETNRRKVLNIHLHDGYKRHAHLRLGDGSLDLDRFSNLLEKIQYHNFVTLEVVGGQEIRDSWSLLRKTG